MRTPLPVHEKRCLIRGMLFFRAIFGCYRCRCCGGVVVVHVGVVVVVVVVVVAGCVHFVQGVATGRSTSGTQRKQTIAEATGRSEGEALRTGGGKGVTGLSERANRSMLDIVVSCYFHAAATNKHHSRRKGRPGREESLGCPRIQSVRSAQLPKCCWQKAMTPQRT